ncbi:MAG: DUF5666 domain-containing protein [Actinomycetes bacterium]
MNLSRTRQRTTAWVASGVLGAGLIGGVVASQIGTAHASTGSSSTTAPATPPAPGGPGRWGGPMGGPMGGMMGLGRALHAQATVVTPGGTYLVVSTQQGTVTATTSSSVTVKSADGYTATYAVTSATRLAKDGASTTLSKIATGNTVHVVATTENGTLTARAIMDGHPAGPGRDGRGPRPGAPGLRAPSTTAPSTTAPSTSSTTAA